jgi:hypothetical protein
MVLLPWGLAAQAHGQDISISADVAPRQARVGEQLRLQVVITGNVNIQGSPAIPAMADFQVYGGGRSSQFNFVNGQVSSSLSFTYILVPKKAGHFSIGPIQITHDNKNYNTQPIAVDILGTYANSAAPAAPAVPGMPAQPGAVAPSQRPAPEAQQKQGQPVFITTSVDRRDVYVNQPVTLTFRFYSSIPLLAQPQYQPPDISGFWSEDLPPQRQYLTQINGKEYQVIEIKTALFPTTAGQAKIGPAHLNVEVQNFQHSSDPFQDDFFRGFFSSGQRVPLESDPIAVHVKPLPEAGKPQNFTGTVGKWSLSARLDRKEAKVGEAVTLEVRIFGEGNVKSVGKPDLPPLTGFKVYETISSSEVQKQNDRVQGVKIYRTLLRPEVTGNLVIPPISYSYFSPGSGKYEKVQVPNLMLKSLAADGVTSGLPAAPLGQPDIGLTQPEGPGVKIMSQDIRYLKLKVPVDARPFELPDLIWAIAFVLPPALLLSLWGWRRWQDKLAADPRFARKLMADQSARKILRQARQARLKQDGKAFYAALSQALSGYLADQMGLSRSGVTQREILQRLQSLGAEAGLLDQLTGLFDECDFARFAPTQRGSSEMAQHEQEAEKLMASLVRILAKEGKK